MAAGWAITWTRAPAIVFVFGLGVGLFYQRRSQPRVRPLLGKPCEIDNRRVLVAVQQLERLARRIGATGQDHRARAGQRIGVQVSDHGRHVSHARENARLLVLGGDQLERDLGRAGGGDVAELAAHQRLTPHQRDHGYLGTCHGITF